MCKSGDILCVKIKITYGKKKHKTKNGYIKDYKIKSLGIKTQTKLLISIDKLK